MNIIRSICIPSSSYPGLFLPLPAELYCHLSYNHPVMFILCGITYTGAMRALIADKMSKMIWEILHDTFIIIQIDLKMKI